MFNRSDTPHLTIAIRAEDFLCARDEDCSRPALGVAASFVCQLLSLNPVSHVAPYVELCVLSPDAAVLEKIREILQAHLPRNAIMLKHLECEDAVSDANTIKKLKSANAHLLVTAQSEAAQQVFDNGFPQTVAALGRAVPGLVQGVGRKLVLSFDFDRTAAYAKGMKWLHKSLATMDADQISEALQQFEGRVHDILLVAYEMFHHCHPAEKGPLAPAIIELSKIIRHARHNRIVLGRDLELHVVTARTSLMTGRIRTTLGSWGIALNDFKIHACGRAPKHQVLETLQAAMHADDKRAHLDSAPHLTCALHVPSPQLRYGARVDLEARLS